MYSNRWLPTIVCAGVFAVVAAVGSSGSSSLQSLRPLPEALQQRHDPVKEKHRRADQNWQSTNWSGYSVTGPKNSISVASGSWTVPSVTCPATGSQYSSFWVGIDGFNSNTVEQTGTDSDCSNGVAQYYAWFEYYPHAAFYAGPGTGISVKPGDVMSASVTFSSPNIFTVTIDNGRGGHFTTAQRVNAQRSSAEWIAEAPSGSGGVLAIANFNQAFFTNSKATRSGKSALIAAFLEPGATVATSNIVQSLTMVQSNGAGGQPSGLGTGNAGGDFSVAYVGPTSASPKK